MDFGHLFGSPYLNIAGDVEEQKENPGGKKGPEKGGGRSGGMRGASGKPFTKAYKANKAD